MGVILLVSVTFFIFIAIAVFSLFAVQLSWLISGVLFW